MIHSAWSRRAAFAFLGLALAACGGGGSSDTPVASEPSVAQTSTTSGSTAFAVLATPTARVALVPLGGAGVLPVLIDKTQPSAAASPSRATVGSDGAIDASFDVDACSVDSQAVKATCIGFASNKVLILDLGTYATSLKTTDIVVTEWDTDAPDASTRFSGGSCRLCGVVSLPGRGSFIVAAKDGYREYTLPTTAGTALVSRSVYAVPITENFGVDLGRQWLIASEYEPEYVGGVRSRKLRIIRLDTGKVYVFDKNTATCEDRTLAACVRFSASEVDAAAVDPATGLIVLQDEVGVAQMFIQGGQAVFDDAAGTFSAPVAYRLLDQGLQSGETAGVLTSGAGHWAFLVSEFTSYGTIGVQKLPSEAASDLAVYAPDPVFLRLSDWSSATCGTTSWYRTDPHAQGYTTSIGGRPLGLSVNSDGSCVAVVDLEMLYTSPRDATHPSNLTAGQDPVASGALRFLKTH